MTKRRELERAVGTLAVMLAMNHRIELQVGDTITLDYGRGEGIDCVFQPIAEFRLTKGDILNAGAKL